MTRTLPALLALVTAGAALAVPAAAPAHAGTTPYGGAGPRVLSIDHGREAILNVDSGEEVDLTYTWSSAGGPIRDAAIDLVPGGPGLDLDEHHVDLGDLRANQSGTEYLFLTAAPGMHTLTLRISGADAPAAEVTLAVWGRGGPSLPRRDSLAGRAFVTERSVFPETGAYFRAWTTAHFLDDRWARLTYRDTWPTQPEPYLPCRRVTRSCQRYTYDARTGELQVGTDRGEVRGRTLRLHTVHRRAHPARTGSRLAFVGRNIFLHDEEPELGRAVFRLTLRKDGTFTRVSQTYPRRHPATQRGRYRIGQRGLLVARTNSGTVLRSGMFFPLDSRGRPRPHKLGVYAFDVWFRPRSR